MLPVAFTSITTHQQNDEHLSPIIKSLEDGTPSEKFVLSRNVLCIRNKSNHDLRIVAPLVLVPMIFKYFHDSPVGNHLGIYKIIQKI